MSMFLSSGQNDWVLSIAVRGLKPGCQTGHLSSVVWVRLTRDGGALQHA